MRNGVLTGCANCKFNINGQCANAEPCYSAGGSWTIEVAETDKDACIIRLEQELKIANRVSKLLLSNALMSVTAEEMIRRIEYPVLNIDKNVFDTVLATYRQSVNKLKGE